MQQGVVEVLAVAGVAEVVVVVARVAEVVLTVVVVAAAVDASGREGGAAA